MKLNLPVYSYEHRSKPASGARLLNCQPEQLPPGASNLVVLTRTPGIKSWTTVGSGPIRGMYADSVAFATGRQDYLYVISGSEWYYVDTAGTATLIGDIGDPVNIDLSTSLTEAVVVNEPDLYHMFGPNVTGTHTAAGNNATVMTDSAASFVVDALVGGTITNSTDSSSGTIISNTAQTVTVAYLNGGTDNDWDTSDAYTITMFGKVTDGDFVSRGAGDVEFSDNFLIFREPNSYRIFTPDQGSATSFNSLIFADCDDNSDDLVGLKVWQDMVLCFGTRSIEIFQNTGASGFTFERVINGTMEIGCLNGRSIAICGSQDVKRVLWVADDYTVRMFADGPLRVSNHGIEQKLRSATILDSFSYSLEGHNFYGLTTTTGTYLYDLITKEWSERGSYGLGNWKGRFHQQFAGKELVGDWTSNKIGELSPTTYDEFGSVMTMEWTYQPIYAEGARAFHNRFEIVLESGVGLTTAAAQGFDPKIMLEKSDDGGLTWDALPDRPWGKRGQTERRAVWYNLGSARERVYRASVSDPVPVRVVDTLVEVDGGRL